MSNLEIQLPIKGFSNGAPNDKQPDLTSPYMNNCRPQDVLENKIRLGQRPGLDKWGNGDQVGAAEQPVVAMIIISSVA